MTDETEPRFVPSPNAEDLNARASDCTNASSYLLETVLPALNEETRTLVYRLMEDRNYYLGVTTLLGKGGITPRVLVVMADGQDADFQVVCEVHREGVQPGGKLH